jgi:hypothetical protein
MVRREQVTPDAYARPCKGSTAIAIGRSTWTGDSLPIQCTVQRAPL